MSKHWTCYPPVASAEAAAYDQRDHSDCTPDEEERAGVWAVSCDGQCGALLFVDSPHEPPQEETYFCSPSCRQWYEEEVDPALLADLDAEMQEQGEEWALLAAQIAIDREVEMEQAAAPDTYADPDYGAIPW